MLQIVVKLFMERHTLCATSHILVERALMMIMTTVIKLIEVAREHAGKRNQT